MDTSRGSACSPLNSGKRLLDKLLTAVFCLGLCGCSSTAIEQSSALKGTALSYFGVYARRSDFEKLMSFYAPDAVLEDIVYGNVATGKTEIRKFLDWNRGTFSIPDAGLALVVKDQKITGNTVITRGTFNPFEYNGKAMGPWEFVIWQEFDDARQIVHQEDWINYTPKQILIGE
ncbi:MAG: nuclear transport factor 2 family protein [Pseudomonadales bacterium]|nr:nuclear transport factor 2 family protein [Pseudomonadales bacterium]